VERSRVSARFRLEGHAGARPNRIPVAQLSCGNVDGQQRTTALCILSGRKPYWWFGADDWEKTIRKYDIRFTLILRCSLSGGAETSGVTGHMEDVHLQRDMELLGHKLSLVGLTGVPTNFDGFRT
jgi:hypothetical protein